MGDDVPESSNAINNKLLIEAIMSTLEPIMDKKIGDFIQGMRHIRKKEFTRTGIGTEKYGKPRRHGDDKTSYHKGSKLTKTSTKCDKAFPTPQHPKELQRCNGNEISKGELSSMSNQRQRTELESPKIRNTEHEKAAYNTWNIEAQSATSNSSTCPEDKAEQSALESQAPTDSTLKERILTVKSPSHVLLDTKISKTLDLTQYWQHYLTGHSFKYSCFNVSISNIMHLFFPMRFQKGTRAEGVLIDMRHKGKPPDWQRSRNIVQALKQGPIRRIGECTSRNSELNYDQDKTLTCLVQIKENPPDIDLHNPRLWNYGTYLDSKKRMKPCLLSLGTGQTVLTTQWREYDVINKPSPYQSQGIENIKADIKQGWRPEIAIRVRDIEFGREHISFFVQNDHYKFDYIDITLWSLQKKPPIAGRRASWKRTRNIQMWEEDQRFKPPDLDQHKHEDLSHFFLIKEEPPDATHNQKSSLCSLGGKFLILVEFKSANLLYLHVDKSDLRSNPFQVGGDDVIMGSSTQVIQHNLTNNLSSTSAHVECVTRPPSLIHTSSRDAPESEKNATENLIAFEAKKIATI